jgi:putative ABC transport system ATP-binding protein
MSRDPLVVSLGDVTYDSPRKVGTRMSAVLPKEANTAAELTDAAVLLNRRETVVAAHVVTRRYGSGDTAVDALRGVSLEVRQGELVAVMGPSGSGKSTLMHILAGLDQPSEGSVSIAGSDITKLSDNDLTKLRRAHIGFVFQFFNLLPMLSAEENITLPARIAGTKIDPSWLEGVLDQVGLGDRRSHRPSELSGGQQQRVAIARALLARPSVLFADEPTGNLDSTTSAEILEVLREAVEGYGQTTIMVTHDAKAAAIADRILFLADGKVVRELGRSTASEVLDALREVTNR